MVAANSAHHLCVLYQHMIGWFNRSCQACYAGDSDSGSGFCANFLQANHTLVALSDVS